MKHTLTHRHAPLALMFTAALSSVVMLQVAGPAWQSTAPTHAQAHDLAADRDPATDVSDVYRAF